jgi:hypothetical protein
MITVIMLTLVSNAYFHVKPTPLVVLVPPILRFEIGNEKLFRGEGIVAAK